VQLHKAAFSATVPSMPLPEKPMTRNRVSCGADAKFMFYRPDPLKLAHFVL